MLFDSPIAGSKGSRVNAPVIAVVIPAYKVTAHIQSVLDSIGSEVRHIFVIDDACPDGSGDFVKTVSNDPRVNVLYSEVNQGVGGAVMTGFRAALAVGSEIIVKVDGDGQMNPEDIPKLVSPIIRGEADYAKGNRFDSITGLREMPGIRVLGNGALSLLTKISTGYWNVTDPTNGFIAIHREVLEALPLDMISKRYFFESDMLFRLSLAKAVVQDVGMVAIYGDEKSNLSITRTLLEFPYRHLLNFHKRLFYNYYLRDMSIASIELPAGLALSLFGAIFGLFNFIQSLGSGKVATSGTVMLSAVPLILGFQLLLAFLSHDISSVPRRVRHGN